MILAVYAIGALAFFVLGFLYWLSHDDNQGAPEYSFSELVGASMFWPAFISIVGVTGAVAIVRRFTS